MSSFTKAVAGLGIAVAGAAITLLLQYEGLIRSLGQHGLQVTGDPPVTVSDGSLRAKSYSDWTTNGNADSEIQPNPANGSLTPNTLCPGWPDQWATGKPVYPAALWTDDDLVHVIAPGATVEIVHDPHDPDHPNDDDKVIITVPKASGPLAIHSNKDSFGQGVGPRHERNHSRPGNVQSITINNPADNPTSHRSYTYTWDKSLKNPHFTLSFCYH